METQIAALDDINDGGRTMLFDDPKTIALSLADGESIPPHQHPGETILFQVLDGKISLLLGDEEHDLTVGDVARFSGDQDISPSATTDARALLVFVSRD